MNLIAHRTFSLLIDALLRKNKVLYAAFINKTWIDVFFLKKNRKRTAEPAFADSTVL
ncbi:MULTISPECIES: hypothetical protein [Paenibacillus]|uniref:hypothetical protein n=1 Tax=Paenibacillus TaxID=44249 RepID=UPI0015BC8B87|nr:hypothetical protein [Paenibacillus odorifer]